MAVDGVTVSLGDGVTVKGAARFLIDGPCVSVWFPWLEIEVGSEYSHPDIPERIKVTAIYAVHEMPVCILFDVWRDGWVTPLYGVKVGRLLCYPGATIHNESGLPYDLALLRKLSAHKV